MNRVTNVFKTRQTKNSYALARDAKPAQYLDGSDSQNAPDMSTIFGSGLVPNAHVKASSASAPAPAPDLSEICRLRLRLRIPGSSAYPRDRSSRHWPPSLDHQIKNPDINASHQERRRKQSKVYFPSKTRTHHDCASHFPVLTRHFSRVCVPNTAWPFLTPAHTAV